MAMSYLDACAEHYRPLAWFLIGSGCRISEAIASARHDLARHRSVPSSRQRDRFTHATTQIKTNRSRRVELGPGLASELRRLPPARLIGGRIRRPLMFVCPARSRAEPQVCPRMA
jgi:integrase